MGQSELGTLGTRQRLTAFRLTLMFFVVILHTEAIPLSVVSYSRHVLPLLVYSHLLLTPNR